MMVDHRLDPCPFCGGRETAVKPSGRVWTINGWSAHTSFELRHWCPVEGPAQGARISFVEPTEDGVIDRWNFRRQS